MSLITLELHHEPPASDGLIELCCEYFESAIVAGVIRGDRHGVLYFGSVGHFFPVVFCPFCRYQHGAPIVDSERQMEYVVVDGFRLCGRCHGTGHYARTCREQR